MFLNCLEIEHIFQSVLIACVGADSLLWPITGIVIQHSWNKTGMQKSSINIFKTQEIQKQILAVFLRKSRGVLKIMSLDVFFSVLFQIAEQKALMYDLFSCTPQLLERIDNGYNVDIRFIFRI